MFADMRNQISDMDNVSKTTKIKKCISVSTLFGIIAAYYFFLLWDNVLSKTEI